MTKHQYYCKDCGTEREGLLDHPAVGIGGYSWNCPRCNGTVDSKEVDKSRKPMTEEELDALTGNVDELTARIYKWGFRDAEKHHGIGGSDGNHK